MIDTFAKHVMSVYELEMFYGDETLKHLMEHAVDLNETMGNFENKMLSNCSYMRSSM